MGFFDKESSHGNAMPHDLEAVLERQEAALQLLEQLRADMPMTRRRRRGVGGGRRDFRRWPTPDTVTVDLHDGRQWHRVETLDCGVPGVRVIGLPAFVGEGPAVARLTTPEGGVVLVLADVMWRDAKAGTAGLFFEFQTDSDREAWSEGIIEALLSRHALN